MSNINEQLSDAEKSLIDCIRETRWGNVDVIINGGRVIMVKKQVRTIRLKDMDDLIKEIKEIGNGKLNISVQEGKPTLIRQEIEIIKMLDTR